MSKQNIKRVYDTPSTSDGYRVLVDRIWPRGLTKEKVKADSWLKEIGPSTALRKWFGHEPEKWEAFSQKYKAELKDNTALEILKQIITAHKTVTLLYSARDEKHNQAVVLQQLLSWHYG